jgi:wyosine [tRNA(Phe)-imidazoG37] synthetase (radical SAM superfamily)
VSVVFGPVPSRRLGRSLGINNIPQKICSYSCAYCQVGRTIGLRAEREAFFDPAEIVRQVQERIAQASRAGETIDYLTFVPDGEPTLDINLGRTIARLRPTGFKVAVITNGSLLWRGDVREDLAAADWVSLKVDAVGEEVWRRINRPHGSLRLGATLEGMLEFSRTYSGALVTETMLAAGINDDPAQVRAVGAHLVQLRPSKAYLAVPIRPPAEPWVYPPDEGVVNRAFQILRELGNDVELLVGHEPSGFVSTGDPEEDLLAITAVHPMREDAVADYLARADADWTLVGRLLAQRRLVKTVYGGSVFYLGRLPGRGAHRRERGTS